ncbi:hypothetical protein BT96DRAFT_839793 [Gymnopus androsaceus JB14]|uniref:Uncharacterized protein n=1 Tax=Gymnopus androsaceus JB14 TaxID=1447944 RepID=A0A6A4GK54_9AGAR|nr:hypothetical protein BT96DRAFT_839793 [Gymnopus androsaceus JB14]
MHTLRRPSHFIGFDQIRHATPPNPVQFLNFPILIAQVDRAEPPKVFPDDSRRYTSSIGTISPDDRQVRATKDISTIVQFMAIDYAMEICELRLQLDMASTSLTVDPSLTPLVLTLNRLNATTSLDARSISFATRPPIQAKIADITIERKGGVEWSRKFPCSMHELLTFELGCSQSDFDNPEGCGIQWWQDKENVTSCKLTTWPRFKSN